MSINCLFKGKNNLTNHNTHLLISILLHIFLLFSFLSLLFWLVIRQISSKAINGELNREIDKNLKINLDIPDKISNYLKTIFSQTSPRVKENNRWLFIYNIVVILFLFITLILTIFIISYSCGSCLLLGEIIMENIFVLIIVGAIEYVFFMYIASKYVPVLPSYLPTILIELLQKKFKS